MRLTTALATAGFVASVAAHATFQELWINGVDQGDCCARLPQSNSPVQSVDIADIACNANAHAATGVCTIAAGSSVTVEMHQQPGDRSCANEAIGGAHYGPMTIYLAKVSDATTAVGSGAAWFKIAEIGLPSSNPDYWGTQVLNDNCGHYTFTIPSDVAAGQYLLRAEAIALHVAGSLGGAQFYMTCYQINITGGGSANPPTVSFPGAYSASDPGILINIYQQINSYTIPGPQPYGTTSPGVATTAWPTTATWNTASQPTTVPHTCAGGGSTPASSSSAKSSSTSSVKTSSTSSAKTSSTSSTKASSTSSTAHTSTTTSSAGNTGTVDHYGQCGGQGWTGGTVCVSPYTCTVLNPYYSQCV